MILARGHTGRLASRWVRVDGREMHYRVSLGPPPPDPIPMVFVHGIAAGQYFQPVAELLAPHHRVYVPDLPGFGGSYRPDEPLSLDLFVRSLSGWLDACKLRPVHLVGQSLGTNIVVEVAARDPGAAASVSLQGVLLAPRLRTLAQLAPRWFLALLQEAMVHPPEVRRGQQQAPFLRGTPLLRVMMEHRIEYRLPLVRCPSAVIRGGRDPLSPSDWARRVAELLPRGRLLKVPETSHTMPGDAPRGFAEALHAFVTGVALESYGRPN